MITAIVMVDAATDSIPEVAAAIADLDGVSEVYSTAGEVDLAASELRRVVQAVPTFADAHYNLATALERLGSKRQAREHLEQYLSLVGEGDDDQAPWISDARARVERL